MIVINDRGQGHTKSKIVAKKHIAKKTDLRELRSFDENYKRELKEAAFMSGRASQLVGKIGNVLSRKTGFKIGFSSIAIPIQMDGKTYDTYFGYIAPNRALRLNVIKGKSDLLASIDFYDSNTDLHPTTNVDLNGFNIVQVIDQIADYITGDFELYDESHKKSGVRITEARQTVEQMVALWLKANPQYVQDIQSGRFDYEAMTSDFITYIRATLSSSKSKISAGGLKWHVHNAIAGDSSFGVNAASIPSVTVQPAIKIEEVLPTQELQDIWNAVQNVSPKQIMHELEEDTRRIAQGDKLLPGILVYGKPGTGKTQTIRAILEEEGIKPVVIDEKISAYSKFLWFCATYHTNEVIIIDDNDSVFNSEDNVNLLKKVLDMKPVRRVEIFQPVKVYGSTDVVDESFDFDSKIIFISNKLSFDTAIKSRLSGVMHEINFTKDEMLELIKENLNGMYRDVKSITDEMREKVYDFIEAIMPVVNDIDYRAFNYCLTYCNAATESGSPDRSWQERSLRLLKDYNKELEAPKKKKK